MINKKVLMNIISVILICWSLVIKAAENIQTQENGYIANNESVSNVLQAMGFYLNRSVSVSKIASRKQVSGKFDLNSPQETLNKLTKNLGLIWYSDGTTIFIYDASEIMSTMITLQKIPLDRFNDFLKKSGLYDSRYLIKGEVSLNTFYVSGPPAYVDLIINAVKLIDKKNDEIELGMQKISVVRLNNTFVNDRAYDLRGQKVIIPGIATVIENLLKNDRIREINQKKIINTQLPNISESKNETGFDSNNFPTEFLPLTQGNDIRVIAYPDTNSILIKGSTEQVDFIEKLVTTLDISKRHIELSLWIIDIDKANLDQIGINWTGSLKIGNRLGIEFNKTGAISTLDGSQFLASVQALEEKNKAFVVSRPVLLAQENVPAIFDNNRTYYTKLIGERTTSLEQVTWGTLISVVPRFSANGEIEMNLNIEDGKEDENSTDKSGEYLPEVGRTLISTVARVPQGKSLLIGGYTRDSRTSMENKVPFLSSIPFIGSLFTYKRNNNNNTIRVFLIHPREIKESLDNFPLDTPENDVMNSEQIERWVKSYIER